MELAISVDAEKVNAYMAQKLLESTLGDKIKVELDNALSRFNGYNSPIQGVIQSYINDVIRSELMSTYKEKIQDAIRVQMTDEKIKELAVKFVDNLKFNDRGY